MCLHSCRKPCSRPFRLCRGQPYLPPSQRRRDFPPPSAWMVWRGSASLGQPCASSLRRVVPESNFFPFRERGKAKCSPSPCDISSIYDCEPRTVVRVRIRGIVVRIRVNETAIRIRTVVRPQHHTRAMPASAFLLSLPPLGWRAASVSSVIHYYIYIIKSLFFFRRVSRWLTTLCTRSRLPLLRFRR